MRSRPQGRDATSGFLEVAEELLVGFAVGIFLVECVVGGIGANRAAPMAEGKMFAFGAISGLHENTGATQEFPAHRTDPIFR